MVEETGTSCVLRIAEITIGVRYSDPALWRALPETLIRFAVPAGEPDLLLRIETLDRPSSPESRLLFDSGGVWRLFEEGSQLRIECRADVFGKDPYKVALLNHDLTTGRV